jgi:hypothetical protein
MMSSVARRNPPDPRIENLSTMKMKKQVENVITGQCLDIVKIQLVTAASLLCIANKWR